MPCLCALKCFPMSVMLFISSYTLTVTSTHPSTQKRCAYDVPLDSVLLLNTRTNSYYFNTGCAGNSKKTWLCRLVGNLGSAPPKPMLSRCQRKVMNSSLSSSERGKKSHSLYFSASVKLSVGEEPRGRRSLQRQDHNSPSPGEAERWPGNLGQEGRTKFSVDKDREGRLARDRCGIHTVE